VVFLLRRRVVAVFGSRGEEVEKEGVVEGLDVVVFGRDPVDLQQKD